MTATAMVETTCSGMGSAAPPTLSEQARCPECGQLVYVLTFRIPGASPVRTLAWHLAPVGTGR